MDDNRIILEKAYRLSKHYEKSCTGCAQSTVAGLLEALGLRNENVFKAASGLADGIGLSRQGSCGSLTASAMVLGLFFGRERKDHEDAMKPMKSYLLCRELYDYFIEENGTSRCFDLQTRLMGRSYNLLSPGELRQAWKADMLAYCSELVGRTSRKTAEIILREQNMLDFR